MNTITQKIALFQRISPCDWDRDRYTVWTGSFETDKDCDECQPDGYVRVTPYVEQIFPALDQGPIIEKKLEKLAEAEQRIREEFQKKLDSIADAKSQLLALSFQPAA